MRVQIMGLSLIERSVYIIIICIWGELWAVQNTALSHSSAISAIDAQSCMGAIKTSDW